MGKKAETSTDRMLRNSLSLLLLLVALNAFGGGIFGIAGAKGVPKEWLEGSPFPSYFYPSIILIVGVGGVCLVSSIGVFRRRPFATKAAYASAFVLFCWIAVQLALIGYVSWLQPMIAVLAASIFFFTWKIGRYDH